MKTLIVLSFMVALLVGSSQSQAENPQVGDRLGGGTVTQVETSRNGKKVKSMTLKGDSGSTVEYKRGGLFKRNRVTITDANGNQKTFKGRNDRRLQKKMENYIESQKK